MDRYGMGVKGETLATEYLKQMGYVILDRNVNFPNVGELDIVAMDGRTLAFIEVKNRFDNRYGDPFAAVTRAKQRKIISASIRYIGLKRITCDAYRYDVIGIINDNIKLIKGAFRVK